MNTIDRKSFIAGIGASGLGAATIVPTFADIRGASSRGRLGIRPDAVPAISFTSVAESDSLSYLMASSNNGPYYTVASVMQRSHSLLIQSSQSWISVGGEWPMQLGHSYAFPGTSYSFVAEGQVTMTGPPSYPIVSGAPPPPQVTGVMGNISDAKNSWDYVQIGYFPTVNAYYFSTLYNGSNLVRWIVGPPLTPNGRRYPDLSRQGGVKPRFRMRPTGRFVEIAGRRYPIEDCGEYTYSETRSATSIEHFRPMATSSQACTLSVIDLFVAAALLAAGTIALASALPLTALAGTVAVLTYGGGVWSTLRQFQSTADTCQLSSPETPVVGSGGPPGMINYPPQPPANWGSTPSDPPDSGSGGGTSAGGYGCGAVTPCPWSQ